MEFIKWLDISKLTFTCHRGRIPYFLNGQQRNYYPDFFVNEWNCYVDVKNDYHYNLSIDKFNEILKNTNVKILLKNELEKLINKRL